jgi:LacI family transcriptional regulator
MKASTTKPRARITDVARRARVSVGTVSHVVTGAVQVSAELRARVQKAIDALGYVPNFHAQGLRRGPSRVIGVCLPHASTAYLNDLSETFEDVASRNGYGVMHVYSRHVAATELDRIKELIRYRVDGLLLVPSTAPRESLDFVHAKGVPLVVVDRPTGDARFDHVVLDNRKAMREVVTRLVALGHARILFVCRSRDRQVTQHRLQGLEDARIAATSPLPISCLELRHDEALLRGALQRALRGRSPPDAIIASNSHQAALVLAALRAIGVETPANVSVVAFDDPEWSRLVVPSLSVVRQPAAAMAEAAFDLLVQRVSARAGAPRVVALDAVVEFRDSVRTRTRPAAAAAARVRTPAGWLTRPRAV